MPVIPNTYVKISSAEIRGDNHMKTYFAKPNVPTPKIRFVNICTYLSPGLL